MANATMAAAVEGVGAKLVEACAGPSGYAGATIKAFTATIGTGNMPVAGLTLDLSALFDNKVLACIVSPIHDPARTTGDLAHVAVYIPASDGAPATGKVHAYRQTAATSGLVKVPDDTEAVTGFVVTGFAIGY